MIKICNIWEQNQWFCHHINKGKKSTPEKSQKGGDISTYWVL